MFSFKYLGTVAEWLGDFQEFKSTSCWVLLQLSQEETVDETHKMVAVWLINC